MIKRTGGAAIIATAVFLAIYSFPAEKEEMVRDVSLQVAEDQGSDILQGDEFVPPRVPVTLVETIDGDTIKVRINGKIETVRYQSIHQNQKIQKSVSNTMLKKHSFGIVS